MLDGSPDLGPDPLKGVDRGAKGLKRDKGHATWRAFSLCGGP